MNEFIEKFKTQIEGFWDLEKEDRKKVLSDILEYANADPQKFIDEVNQVRFDNDSEVFPVISEALSADTDKWGQFYVDQLDDILETAKQSAKPHDILSNLVDFAYIENDSRPFVQEIVDRLYKELDSENLHIRLASIWILPDFFYNDSIRRKNLILEKLQQQLFDKNWKVRVVAFRSLGLENLLPRGYKLSLKDRLAKLIFGEPRMI